MEPRTTTRLPSAPALAPSPWTRSTITLVDALDRVIDKGAVVNGEIVLRVADVDLIFLGLRLIVTSVARAEARGGAAASDADRPATAAERAELARLRAALRRVEAELPRVLQAEKPQEVERSIGKLVLTLVELLRQLLEREAVRRVDRGTLTRAEVEKLGLTFQLLARKIQELKAVFGIREELNLDLGPLGRLL